jgi:hypothetical protein
LQSITGREWVWRMNYRVTIVSASRSPSPAAPYPTRYGGKLLHAQIEANPSIEEIALPLIPDQQGWRGAACRLIEPATRSSAASGIWLEFGSISYHYDGAQCPLAYLSHVTLHLSPTSVVWRASHHGHPRSYDQH